MKQKPIWKFKTCIAHEALMPNAITAIGRIWSPQGYEFHDYSGKRKGNKVIYKVSYKLEGIKI